MIRKIFYGLAIVFGISLMGISNISESHAQEGMCDPPSYEAILNQSSVIFTGTVISKEQLSEKHNHNIQFEINELLLGKYERFIDVMTSDVRMFYSEPIGGNPFEVGEKYFVMAMLLQDNKTLYADNSGSIIH